MASAIVQASDQMWDMCLKYEDIEGAFRLLSKDAEQYTMARATGSTFTPPHHRGRGILRLEQREMMPRADEEGVVTTACQRLQQFCRRLEEVDRQLHHRGR